MPQPPRPPMPTARRREVLVEAGHRCAIPTCKQIPVEVHHIDGDRTNHAFENLIALCPNDHSRADRDEIDRPSLRTYKANLGLLSSRYGDLERRMLDGFVENPDATLVLPAALSVLMNYLVRDGIVTRHVPPMTPIGLEAWVERHHYKLTDAGRTLVGRIASGRPVESDD
jgi:DNA-binding HxlR family transcriptional regulator